MAGRRRMRLPNGFGQISKINGRKLRNPYRAMITVGKTDEGKPICKTLKPQGYFSTYNDAYTALLKYHEDSKEKPVDKITVGEVYEKWSEEYFENLSTSGVKNYVKAWKYCQDMRETPMVEIRIHHIKSCMSKAPSSIKQPVKQLWNKLFDYAIEYDMVIHNYARNYKNGNKRYVPEKSHNIFTESEMNTLWKSLDLSEVVGMILVQCYSGWRPNELCNLKISDVDLENYVFCGGSKTQAGKNRSVPIHEKIRPIVSDAYARALEAAQDVLYDYTYKRYYTNFNNVVAKLGLSTSHKPHDPRKHFITMAKQYKMDEYAIKYIVGHTITDLTESVYTERNIDWLMEEMFKIPV